MYVIILKEDTKKVGSEISRRLVCFLISLAVHASLLYLALHIASPVKVYPIKEEITNLIIVPPEKLFLPRGYEDIEGTGEFDDLLPERGTRQRRIFQKEGMLQEKMEAETGILPGGRGEVDKAGSPMESLRTQELTGQRTPRSGHSSGFKLQLPQNIHPESSADVDLNLSPYFERGGKVLSEIDKDKFMKSLSEYTYTDLSKAQPAKGGSSAGSYARSRGSSGGRVSFNIKGYNLTPWATEVVNKIQMNWIIPPSQRMIAKGTVRILVIVERDGKLSSAEMDESSDVSALDLLALNAINSSAPFPKLPDDFPFRSLEAYFVFQYND